MRRKVLNGMMFVRTLISRRNEFRCYVKQSVLSGMQTKRYGRNVGFACSDGRGRESGGRGKF